MERKNGNITTLMLGTSTYSESRLSRLISHLRQATVVGFSAMTLLMLAFPARGGPISFQTVSGVLTSRNITDYGVTPIVFGSNSWQTTNDGIGCVVFPGTAPGNVCGSGRFSGTGFITDPGRGSRAGGDQKQGHSLLFRGRAHGGTAVRRYLRSSGRPVCG
jgi:hypothetical protein